jgi:hypothetical protein
MGSLVFDAALLFLVSKPCIERRAEGSSQSLAHWVLATRKFHYKDSSVYTSHILEAIRGIPRVGSPGRDNGCTGQDTSTPKMYILKVKGERNSKKAVQKPPSFLFILFLTNTHKLVMRPSIVASYLLQNLLVVQAAKHQLFTSTYGTPFIYTVEFDDKAHSLKLLASTNVPVGSQWLALSVSVGLI